jgi:hypothetical protein
MNSRKIARGLAWFGIGLGVVELLAPRVLARAIGLRMQGKAAEPVRGARDRFRRLRPGGAQSAKLAMDAGRG